MFSPCIVKLQKWVATHFTVEDKEAFDDLADILAGAYRSGHEDCWHQRRGIVQEEQANGTREFRSNILKAISEISFLERAAHDPEGSTEQDEGPESRSEQ